MSVKTRIKTKSCRKVILEEDVLTDIIQLSQKRPNGQKVKNKKVTVEQNVYENLAEREEISCKKPTMTSDSDDGSDSDIPSEDSFLKQSTKTNFSDNYFMNCRKKSNTSFHDLSKMKNFKFETDGWQNLLLKMPDKHRMEKNILHQHYQMLFEKWHFLLSDGFNILLYGLGSKAQILDWFCNKIDKNSVTLVINGFFPGLTIKHILNEIMEQVMKQDGHFRDSSIQANFIKENIDDKDLYIIINNIEANLLGSEKSQSALSSLAENPNIHFVASIDHINAPLVWDQAKMSKFKWVWFDVTSFSPYTAELSYENSILTQKQGKLALASLLHVYNSLTPNAQGIFLILARHQYAEKDNSSYLGMPFQEFYQECREAFLVNSDLTLRAQLTEFRDHKLLRLQKSSDGVEIVHLLIDISSLSEFLEMQDEK